MVAIRLRRQVQKRPFFRVVVTDSRAARDSSFVEILGHYNPHKAGDRNRWTAPSTGWARALRHRTRCERSSRVI
jgi:ribosomal protein S16